MTDEQIDALWLNRASIHGGDLTLQLRDFARAILAAPAAYDGPKKWTPDEAAQGNKGIRWVTETGVAGRPTEHDVLEYLEATGADMKCGCDDCKRRLAVLAAPAAGVEMEDSFHLTEPANQTAPGDALVREAIRMRDALDTIYRHNEAARTAVVMHYGTCHAPRISALPARNGADTEGRPTNETLSMSMFASRADYEAAVKQTPTGPAERDVMMDAELLEAAKDAVCRAAKPALHALDWYSTEDGYSESASAKALREALAVLEAMTNRAAPAVEAAVADAEIKAAYIAIFGSDRDWLRSEGSCFIEGYKAGKRAAAQKETKE